MTIPGLNANTSPTTIPTLKVQDNGGSSGLGTGPIIGLSITGGIAWLGIVLFLIWKFSQKNQSAIVNNIGDVIPITFLINAASPRQDHLNRVWVQYLFGIHALADTSAVTHAPVV